MKKILIITTFLCFFLLQSCISVNTYKTEQDYINMGKEYYKEYRNECFIYKTKNIESINFVKTEQYYLKAYELNPNRLDTIFEILTLYWKEKLSDKFIYWIDILNNRDNDKYYNYLNSASYCMKLAKTTNADIYLKNTNFDRRKIEYESDLYSPSYVEDICQQAWLYGTKSFGIILWETVINCLDNAYRIKQTPEILNMYSETYQMFSSKLRIASYTRYGDIITDISFSACGDLNKSNEYLQLSIKLEDNWEAHYKQFLRNLYKETSFSGGAYDNNNIPWNVGKMWQIPHDKDKVPNLMFELNKAIDLATSEQKAQLIYEKANIYFYSLRQYDTAKELYNKCLEYEFKPDFIINQISNCETQKQNDKLYLKCAYLLGLNTIEEYFDWKFRTNYGDFCQYLNVGQSRRFYKENDLIVIPEQRLSIVDVSYENGMYKYLITAYGQTQLSKCCKISSPIKLKYLNINESIITEPLILKYIGTDVYKSFNTIKECDMFQNLAIGTQDYVFYKNILIQIQELESQIIK